MPGPIRNLTGAPLEGAAAFVHGVIASSAAAGPDAGFEARVLARVAARRARRRRWAVAATAVTLGAAALASVRPFPRSVPGTRPAVTATQVSSASPVPYVPPPEETPPPAPSTRPPLRRPAETAATPGLDRLADRFAEAAPLPTVARLAEEWRAPVPADATIESLDAPLTVDLTDSTSSLGLGDGGDV